MRAACVVLMWILCTVALSQTRPLNEDAVRYLEFLREEEQELHFQLEHEEITAQLYRRAILRIKILKELVNFYGRGHQPLPELHVVTAEEVEPLIAGGLQKLRQARPGQNLGGAWRYLKRVYREGILFYVLERRSQEVSYIETPAPISHLPDTTLLQAACQAEPARSSQSTPG